MKKALVYMTATLFSGMIGAGLSWFVAETLIIWIGLGYLFVALIWLASWWCKKGQLQKIAVRRRIIQMAISLIWWPAAIAGGLLGFFAAQLLNLPSGAYSAAIYCCALAIAITLGILSLYFGGARLSRRFIFVVIASNVVVLICGLAIFNYFQNPPFPLSNHYTTWLILILFVPLGALNGFLYGVADQQVTDATR